MSETTSIGWTDATFNPWWGCVEVSRECDNCYARVWARRTGAAVWGKHSPRRPASESYWRLPFTKLRRKADELGRPCRVFCASMADVFERHPDLPPLRERLWDVIERTPWIDWQLLTKRPRSVQLMAPWGDDWPPNVWIGTSIGAPEHTWRADVLRQIPAAVRFISAEPLLDSLYVGKRSFSLDGIHWVIIGGESGGKARPFNLEHAREIIRAAACPGCLGDPDVDQDVRQAGRVPVAALGVGFQSPRRITASTPLMGSNHCEQCDGTGHRPAVFVKQFGAKPVTLAYGHDLVGLGLRHPKGEDIEEWPADLRIREFPASRPREGEAASTRKGTGS